MQVRREDLMAATNALMECALNAKDSRGLPILMEPDKDAAKRAVLAYVAALGPDSDMMMATSNDVFLARMRRSSKVDP